MSTRLIDPSDDALNEAFAEKVAGWTNREVFCGVDNSSRFQLVPPSGDLHATVPSFTTSADAVLPFVSKLKEVGIHYCNGDWFVRFWSEKKECANCDSLAKALVIALLRAHGVEIEFTK